MPLWDQACMVVALEDELGLPVDILVKCIHNPDTTFETMSKSRAKDLSHSRYS